MKTVEQRLEDAVLSVAELAQCVAIDAIEEQGNQIKPNYIVEFDLMIELKNAVEEWNAASAALIETQRRPIE